jgi:hypothetical protein
LPPISPALITHPPEEEGGFRLFGEVGGRGGEKGNRDGTGKRKGDPREALS